MFVWIVCVAGKVNDCCNGQLVFFQILLFYLNQFRVKQTH